MKYTSLKLSKWLQEKGFDKWTACLQDRHGNIYLNKIPRIRLADGAKCDGNPAGEFYPAYDILNDLCVKYAKEVFGEEDLNILKRSIRCISHVPKLSSYRRHSSEILSLLQQGKQDEAEEYIMKHSILTTPLRD